jgi:hypothetical protein
MASAAVHVYARYRADPGGHVRLHPTRSRWLAAERWLRLPGAAPEIMAVRRGGGASRTMSTATLRASLCRILGRMGTRWVVVALLLLSTVAGCSSSSPAAQPASPSSPSLSDLERTLAAEEEALLKDLSELGYTPEVLAFTGPSLPLGEYTRRANEECKRVKTFLAENPKPSKSEPLSVVVGWAVRLIGESSISYRRVAALRPPAQDEADVREQFLAPYFDHLNATERLFMDVLARDNRAAAPDVQEEIEVARKNVANFASKHDMPNCIS